MRPPFGQASGTAIGRCRISLILLMLLPPTIPAPAVKPAPPTPMIRIHVLRQAPMGVSRLRMGVTHTQYSLDSWGDPAAITRSKRLLETACSFQNQHLMGWGADNPEPSPGVFHWASLDARIALIRSMHATLVITLCGAPDWMKGGKPGETDWTKLETAPLPDHYADFADLARRVAQRYPDVRFFQVWNEMKGLWDPKANNWDFAGYTRLYNAVYDALKSVRHSIQIGGPYLVIEGTGSNRGGWETEAPVRARQWQVINYWLEHKHGADFIALDRGLVDFHDHHTYTPADQMALTHTFGDVARQIRAKTMLPLWWAEYYGGSAPDPGFIPANYASILRQMVLTGASVALLWQPQDDPGSGLPAALFTDTRKPGGGQPLPLYRVFKTFHDRFGPGTSLYQAMSSSADVEALASSVAVLLIHGSGTRVKADVDGRTVLLGPFEVKTVIL